MDEYDFREVTDKLGMDAKALAKAFGVPVQSVRQMRADPNSTAHRPPPANWRQITGRLARQKALELLRIANDLNRA
jgi:hypothetical protein